MVESIFQVWVTLSSAAQLLIASKVQEDTAELTYFALEILETSEVIPSAAIRNSAFSLTED